METEKARQLLQERIRELEERREAAVRDEGLEEGQVTAAGEFGGTDQHPADIGTEMFEREKAISIAEDIEGRLQQINTALGKLEQGTYGLCEQCHQPIPTERLEIRPESRFCLEHQEMAEHEPG